MKKNIDYNFRVLSFESREEMGRFAAKEAGEALRKELALKEEVNCIFAAAPSQNEFLKYLSKENVEWNRVNAFHMDEYVGLKKGDKRAFSSYLKEHIFDIVPFKNVYYINASAEDFNEEVKRYSELLKNNKVDLTFMGIGENGHIAFNDPHVAKFNDNELMKIVDLDEKCRMQQVHDKCFDSLDEVPKYAVTLTIPALLRAKKLFCMVPSSTKAEAVKRTIMGEISENCPATIMRMHECASLYLDKESSALI